LLIFPGDRFSQAVYFGNSNKSFKRRGNASDSTLITPWRREITLIIVYKSICNWWRYKKEYSGKVAGSGENLKNKPFQEK